MALVLGYGERLSTPATVALGVRMAAMGYAVPGADLDEVSLIPVI